MTYSSKHLYHIDAAQEYIFKAISTIEGLSNWWTVQTAGDTAVGGEIQFDFGDFTGPKMKVIASVPNSKVVWECIDSPHGWIGNTFTFLLDENDGKTRVRFSHDGFPEQDDFFAICNFSWGRYLQSLRQYCQTGKGEAFGSDGYR
jgi:uncharacterized protein YndB with AHSA1/START domain